MNSRMTLLLVCLLPLWGCGTPPRPPLKLADHVDIPRFMGDWYVIANIPTWIEKDATNAVESYQLNPDGSIATTFTFHAGQPEGPLKRYEPRGFIKDKVHHAIWEMQFLWPFRSDFRIVFVSPDYQETIIGREDRDYVWIMARTPTIPLEHFQKLTELLQQQGYDINQLQKVPQAWGPQ